MEDSVISKLTFGSVCAQLYAIHIVYIKHCIFQTFFAGPWEFDITVLLFAHLHLNFRSISDISAKANTPEKLLAFYFHGKNVTT